MWEVLAGGGPHSAAIIGIERIHCITADGNVGGVVGKVLVDGGSHEVAAAGNPNPELFGFGVSAEEVGISLASGEAEGKGGNES